MRDLTATPAIDRSAVRGDLERTHEAYRELIAGLPDAHWQTRSGNRAFTCGQLAWHLASAVEFSAGLIDAARKGRQMSVPAFVMPLLNWLNELRIRRGARAATRQSVLADYARHQERLLRLLDEVTDAEFAIVKTNFAIARSVRDMFAIPVEHLAEHAPEIRAAL